MPTPAATHRDRLETCLNGQTPDQVPVALWRHFPVDDQTPEGLAAAVVQFQNTYDFDLIKVTPASSFCVTDWGARDEWRGNPEGTREYTRHPIRFPEDWAKISPLDPRQGSLNDQITCLRLLVAEYHHATPILQTVFSPLSQAKNLLGKQNLTAFLREHPQILHAGLEIITQTTLQFIEEASKTGIDGIFYAVQYAQYGLLSEEEFNTFGRVYDLQVLEAVRGLWANMLHLHGEHVMFDAVQDYPVQIINWHDRSTPPTLAIAKNKFPGVVCGGLRQWDSMVLGTPRQVLEEARMAISETQGQRFILGTGCVLPITAPHGNILAARRSVLKNPTGSLGAQV